MSKSIKLKNNVYLSTQGIVHNRKVLADIIYPVGSIYISVNSTNPSTYYGGTWVQIKDRFLLACGSTYSNGATGGEATHKLIEDEIPSHTHSYNKNVNPAYETVFISGNSTAGMTSQGGGYGLTSGYASIGNTGGGKAHNNMPPYLAVYVWKRTA